ncbi:MAG: MFS transporter, partial [Deltaproteobacteria bacterium]|nr:MFS transporter [Deltaproteobacteria bacterium]
MATLIRLNPTTRGLCKLYSSTLLSGSWAMIIPTIPVLAMHFGISAGAAAQIVTALAVGRSVGMPLSGAVLDRLGTRGALVGGPVVVSIAALLAAVTPWFGVMLVMLLVMGVGDSIWTLGREVAGIDLARKDQRGRVLSGFHGIHNIGLALGPLIGGMLTEAVGFKVVFIAYAACAAGSLPLGLVDHGA